VARESVRQHLVADVPVGVFISSGVDSTSVATLATEAASCVQTICVGFDQQQFDESAEAEGFARALGTRHQTLRISASDIRSDFEHVLAATDQPTVDGFNSFYVSRAARQAGLTVALSGLGGDELFGGYASFRDVPRAERWLRFARPLRWGTRILRASAAASRSRGVLKFAEAVQRPPTSSHLYLLRRELFLPAYRRALGPLPAGCDSLTGLSLDTMANFAGIDSLDSENRVSMLELSGYMRHMLLRDADVFSMSQGLELRVPLLDHQVVESASRLPGKWKRPGKVPKPLLIDAVGPRLPKRVRELPKRGFTFPWAEWFRGELATFARDRLNDRGIWTDIGFAPGGPAEIWERFRRWDPAVGGLHVLALAVLADLVSRQRLTVP